MMLSTTVLTVVVCTEGAIPLLDALAGGEPRVEASLRDGAMERKITLEQVLPLSPDCRLEVVGASGRRSAQVGDQRFWQAELDDGLLFLSGGSDHVHGWTRRHGEFRRVTIDGDMLLEGDAAAGIEDRRPCGGLASLEPPQPFNLPDKRAARNHGTPRSGCRQVRIAFDSDWEFTNDAFGGDPDAATAYIIELAAAVSVIYSADLDITLQIAYTRTWADASDPYDPSEQDADLLDQFQAEWNANDPHPDRHLAHLLSGSSEPASSGLAWRSSICQFYGYSYASGIDGTFANPPPSHSWNIWDLLVVSHEVGHNLGARHTHEMSPPIDGCGNGDCTSAWGGTIMSYCHTCAPNYYSNISMEFHTRVQDDIEAVLSIIEGGSCDLSISVSTDIDGSGAVDRSDLILVISDFGPCETCVCLSDVDGTGDVDVFDLLQVLQEWE